MDAASLLFVAMFPLEVAGFSIVFGEKATYYFLLLLILSILIFNYQGVIEKLRRLIPNG